MLVVFRSLPGMTVRAKAYKVISDCVLRHLKLVDMMVGGSPGIGLSLHHSS
jgi:hypothetical protein